MNLFDTSIHKEGIAGIIDKVMLAIGRIRAIGVICMCVFVILIAVIAIIVLIFGSSTSESFSFQQLHDSRVGMFRRGLIHDTK